MLGFDAFTWIFGVAFVLFLLALRSIWISRAHATRVKIIWTAISLVPYLGPLGWFLLGRERRRSH